MTLAEFNPKWLTKGAARQDCDRHIESIAFEHRTNDEGIINPVLTYCTGNSVWCTVSTSMPENAIWICMERLL